MNMKLKKSLLANNKLFKKNFKFCKPFRKQVCKKLSDMLLWDSKNRVGKMLALNNSNFFKIDFLKHLAF